MTNNMHQSTIASCAMGTGTLGGTTAPLTCWLRTNGVNTNGATAKVTNFDGLGKEVRPGTFGNIKVGYPKSPVKQLKFAVTPLVLTPFVPFPNLEKVAREGVNGWSLVQWICIGILPMGFQWHFPMDVHVCDIWCNMLP